LAQHADGSTRIGVMTGRGRTDFCCATHDDDPRQTAYRACQRRAPQMVHHARRDATIVRPEAHDKQGCARWSGCITAWDFGAQDRGQAASVPVA